MHHANRWYDKHKRLAPLLEGLKPLKKHNRDKLVAGVMGIVKEQSTLIMEKFVLEFPLDLSRKRWYDDDPYLWVLFNGLKHADKTLLHQVTEYLEKAMV